MIWHIAFAVPNLEEGMDQFGKALNLTWNPIKSFEGENAHAGGEPFTLRTRLVFATAGPCALELFESVPDTPNEPAKGTVFHHMGYWTDNVVTEQQRLEQCGWFHAGGPVSDDSRAAFFSSSLGIFFEACNVSAQRKGLEKYYPGVAPGMKQPDKLG
ncbi:VOC family protein [Pseudonocardia halophobica]|uniref:VOC family protein n=1 Tax=Pseudonocardia halophobica TaxID=29401 RepID=UPI003D8D3DBB